MIRYVLDANALIGLLNNNKSKLTRMTESHEPGEISVSSIVLHELYYGAFKSSRMAENVSLIDALQLPILEFDKEDARAAGQVRALLSLKGTPIGPFDILIAGQCLSRDLILITHNTKEFRRIPQLKFEDWEKS